MTPLCRIFEIARTATDQFTCWEKMPLWCRKAPCRDRSRWFRLSRAPETSTRSNCIRFRERTTPRFLSAAIEQLIEAFDAHQTYHEQAIRAVLGIHDRPFLLYIDHVNRPQLSPLQDAFTFNIETDELVIFTDDPSALVDAILEMALFVRGFSTVMGLDDEWKVQVAIGTWRYVREALKVTLGLETTPYKQLNANLELESVERFNLSC